MVEQALAAPELWVEGEDRYNVARMAAAEVKAPESPRSPFGGNSTLGVPFVVVGPYNNRDYSMLLGPDIQGMHSPL